MLSLFARLVRAALKITRHYQDAEDVAQEALIENWKANGPEDFPWLKRKTRWRALDLIKWRKRRKRAGEQTRSELDHIPAKESTIDLDDFPSDVREVLELKLQGYTHKEVCQLLGISEREIRRRLKRMRKDDRYLNRPS